jgi:hypothetical protein
MEHTVVDPERPTARGLSLASGAHHRLTEHPVRIMPPALAPDQVDIDAAYAQPVGAFERGVRS